MCKGVKQNPDRINWYEFSINSNTKSVEMLLENPTRINWCMFCHNDNYKAIELIEKNLNKITTEGWSNLCLNRSAIHILQNNLDKVDWCELSRNENIFMLDLQAMREQNQELKESIIQAAMHPRRIQKWLDAGLDLDDI